jgi:alpha-tubulin suppressor-like RCC1 family protein
VNATGELNGAVQSFAIDSSGNGYAWGGAITSLAVARSSPVQVGAGRSWISFTATQSGIAGIIANGAIYYWGRGTEGQRGDGTVSNGNDTLLPGSGSGGRSYVQVFGGFRSLFAIDSEKNLWTWGFTDRNGRWTINSGSDSYLQGHSSPVQIGIESVTNLSPTLISNNWKKVFAGENYNLGIKTDNKLYVWGIQYPLTYGNQAVSLSANSTNLIASDAAINIGRSVIAVLSTANTA